MMEMVMGKQIQKAIEKLKLFEAQQHVIVLHNISVFTRLLLHEL